MFKFTRRDKEEGLDVSEKHTVIGAIYGQW